MRADRSSPRQVEFDRSAAAERELQTFSYIVSHDLAASFRQVSAFSGLLLNDLGDDLTERQQAYAQRIQAAAGDGQLMLEQLLDYSRAQQKPLQRACGDITQVMRLCLLQLGEPLQAAGAEVSLEPLGEVDSDPELLSLAFRHLLDNAVKFRRPDVPLRIDIAAAHDRSAWRIRIADNGLGVEPDYRQKAFDMFQRLGRDKTYPGVGAGLAICRRIARRHGGETIFLDCNEGACVELSLPRAAAVRSAPVNLGRP